ITFRLKPAHKTTYRDRRKNLHRVPAQNGNDQRGDRDHPRQLSPLVMLSAGFFWPQIWSQTAGYAQLPDGPNLGSSIACLIRCGGQWVAVRPRNGQMRTQGRRPDEATQQPPESPLIAPRFE